MLNQQLVIREPLGTVISTFLAEHGVPTIAKYMEYMENNGATIQDHHAAHADAYGVICWID